MATRSVRKSVSVLKTFNGARRNDLFVKKISWVTGASELTKHFSQFGKVKNITLPFDLRTGLHKGFAFISFENNDFYENMKKFNGKHVIDDEEVICSLASEGKPSLLTDASMTPFNSKNGFEMDISKANSDDEVGIVEFIKTETNIKEKEVKGEADSEINSINSANFQDSEKQPKKTNSLQTLQKSDDSKETSEKNGLFKNAVSRRLADMVRENEGDNEMHKKTYTSVRLSNSFHITKNGFTDRINTSNRSFMVSTMKVANQKYSKKG